MTATRADNVAALYDAFAKRVAARDDLALHPYDGQPRIGFSLRMTRARDGLAVDLYVAPTSHRSDIGQVEWELWAGPEAMSLSLLAPLEVRRANFNLGFQMQGTRFEGWQRFTSAEAMAMHLLQRMERLEPDPAR